MGSLYYVDAAKWLRDAGCTVHEVDSSWKSRARSSGGFASPPLGVQWHHTASKTQPSNDYSWQANGSDDAPIGNATIMRDGTIWMVAAGAANTAGKGGPIHFSRGTVPQDSGNTTTWAFEVANNGVGEAWPQAQIDAYFRASNAMNQHFGNQPSDLMTHAGYCDASCPGRKIDPATAAAVQGPWRPRSVNSSGTWNQEDVRAEANRRGDVNPPHPPDGSGKYTVVAGDSWWGISQKYKITVDQLLALNPPATSSTVIHPGQVLNVPGGSAPPPKDWVQTGKDSTTPPGSPAMSKGFKHSNVTWLQAVLCSMNQANGTPYYNPAWVDLDSIGSGPDTAQLFGDASFNSVKVWQQNHALPADGVYGQQTATKMSQVRGK